MPEYPCAQCGKVFKSPAHHRRHLARKTPCAPILEAADHPPELLEDPDLDRKKCRFCGRIFSFYTVMRRHVRQNCKIAPNAKNGGAPTAAQILAGDGAQIAQQVDNGQKMQVVIHVHGQETTAHLPVAKVRGLLEDALKAPTLPQAVFTALIRAAMLVYSDAECPENLTCYLPNKKTNGALVHTAGGWEVQPTSLVLLSMARKSVDALFARQPYEDAEKFDPLMVELRDNEEHYAAGVDLRPILARNKDLLERALGTLPVAGA